MAMMPMCDEPMIRMMQYVEYGAWGGWGRASYDGRTYIRRTCTLYHGVHGTAASAMHSASIVVACIVHGSSLGIQVIYRASLE